MSIVLQSFSCWGKHQNQIQIHFDYLGQEWAAAVVSVVVAAAVGYFHCFGPQYQLLQFGGDDLHRLAGHLAGQLVENHCSCLEHLSLLRQPANGYSEVVHCIHQR